MFVKHAKLLKRSRASWTNLDREIDSVRNVVHKSLERSLEGRLKSRGGANEILHTTDEFAMAEVTNDANEPCEQDKTHELKTRPAYLEADLTDLTSSKMCWMGAKIASSRVASPLLT
jgi:flavin reductase (DIM6/NTAB) family NADH-FMN oxidoreductase RutF